MKKCIYCGKEHSAEAVQCFIDGQPLAEIDPASLAQTNIALVASPSVSEAVTTPPSTGTRLTERQMRIFELVLVCASAFGLSILYSFYYLVHPEARSSGGGTFKWTYNMTRQAMVLVLLWYVLLRRSKSFSDLGLSWKWKDAGWAIILIFGGAFAFKTVYAALYYSGMTSVSRMAATGEIGRYLFGGGVVYAAFLFQFINPFFEELIVRAYVMTEVKHLTNSTTAAILFSTVLQTSYHLYQGIPAALSDAAMFLIFSIYYAKTNRITPVILAHLYADVSGTLWYGFFH